MAQARVSVSVFPAGGRSAGRSAVVGAGLWLGAAWLACGGASNDGLEVPLERISQAGAAGTAEPGGLPDAGSAPDASAANAAVECPPSLLGDSSGPTTAWARNPETATCCPYADQIFVPAHFPSFDSLDACENSCRCAELVGVAGISAEEAGTWVSERISLECYCSEKTCPESPEAIADLHCAGDQSLHRSEGCGRTMLELVTGLGVWGTWVFDQASGTLVGVSDASDVTSYPCRAYGTSAGAELDCPEAERCRLCGELEINLGETTPPCE